MRFEAGDHVWLAKGSASSGTQLQVACHHARVVKVLSREDPEVARLLEVWADQNGKARRDGRGEDVYLVSVFLSAEGWASPPDGRYVQVMAMGRSMRTRAALPGKHDGDAKAAGGWGGCAFVPRALRRGV